MAAPDMSVLNPGQVNGAGDAKALYLKVFAGETLKAFNTHNKFKQRTQTRTIQSGKSASFPAFGKLATAYHTKGTMLVGQSANFNEIVINIDDKLISDFSIADIDEAMSHFDFRGPMAQQAGEALAKKYDTNLAQVIALAARAAATVTGNDGGSVIEGGASVETDADDFVDAVFTAAQYFDEKGVPETGRFVSVRPAMYYKLVNSSSKAIHRDYGGAGSVSEGVILRIAGMEVVKSNHIPSTNVASGPTAYQGDFTDTVGLCWHPTAAGTVELMGLATEAAYLIQNQAWLLVAKYVVGHGILRPECAVEITKTEP